MMDCDTTGIEPDIALVKYKKLVGEGFLKIVNQTVPGALRKLGYTPEQVDAIVAYVNERETIEGAPELKPEHLSVFDCAFKPMNGTRSIHYMGHLRMMSAVQPFLSGAISKTVNMPENATPEEIETVYLEGWRMGLKAIAIYRDNSKRSQPLNTGKKKDSAAPASAAAAAGRRRRRPGRAEGLPPPPPGRAPGDHAQVRHRRPRGLHHRRPLRRRPARRNLPQDGQGRLHHQRPDGHLRDHRQRRPPVRRAAPRPGPQVRPRPLRAVRLHQQPGNPDRQVDRRLHLPLDGLALPAGGRPSEPGSGRPVGGR
jgi:ribonucleotide reductase alpha subunit